MWFLIFMFLLISPVYASCTGTVQGVELGSNNEILLLVKYSVDGVDEPTIDKKTYFLEKINGLTFLQIKTKIENDIIERCNQITYAKYKKLTADPFIESKATIATNILNNLKAKEIELKAITKTTVDSKIKLDTDADNKFDQEWTIKTDGTKTTINITPEPIP